MISKTQENTISSSSNSVDLPNIDEALPEETKAEEVLSKIEQDLLKVQKIYPNAAIVGDIIVVEELNKCIGECLYDFIIAKNNNDFLPRTLQIRSYRRIEGVQVFASEHYVIGDYNGKNYSLFSSWKHYLKLVGVSDAYIKGLEIVARKVNNYNSIEDGLPYMDHYIK